jgi:glycosyltransferase involved in cell wall biosynthesis
MKLSVVIIAKNEEEVIAEAIKSALWAEEVVVLDTGSIDKTPQIAHKLGARVARMPTKGLTFARWRTEAIGKSKGEWLFYLDADERITPGLRKEILEIVNSKEREFSAYAAPRENYYLGKRMRWGGAWPDYVERLFYKKNLKKWIGRLHERPVFKGKLGYLENPLEHYTHRDLTSMLKKTIKWSRLEAEELYRAGHPPVTWWRFLRIMLTELWDRGIKKQGFRDGTVGVIEIIFQMFSRFITYARLWEMQTNSKLKIKN